LHDKQVPGFLAGEGENLASPSREIGVEAP
jgi:hypothetical protein